MSDLARNSLGLGARPALVLVDLIRGFTDPACPLGSESAAVVAANECALRYQASTLLGSFFRGQSATYTHLVGAVAARLHLAGADADTWANAFRLAFAILPKPVESALLSSDAKAFAYVRPHDLEVERYSPGATGIVAELQRAIVVGPIARLELWPENPSQPDGHDPLIEAQMAAERFHALGLKDGDKLVVSPRKARVFLQG